MVSFYFLSFVFWTSMYELFYWFRLASTKKVYKDLTMVNILVNLNLNKELDVSTNTTAVLIFTTPFLISELKF